MGESEAIQDLLKKAEEARGAGNLDEAISLCQQAIQADNRSVPSYTKLAELYVEKNEPAKAAEQYMFIAGAYYESKLMKGALKHYQKVLELDPNSLDARVKLAEIYEAESMEREAKLETFKVAEMFFEAGNMAQAEVFAQKAVALKSIEARYTLGLVHLKRDMVKEAISEFEQLIKFKPNHFQAITALASAYIKMNRASDAVGILEKAKKLKSDDLAVLEGLAVAQLAKNVLIDAVSAYTEAAEASGKQGDLDRLARLTKKLVELGALFQKNKDVERARTLYQRVLAWDPENAEAKSQLGQLAAQPAKPAAAAPPPAASKTEAPAPVPPNPAAAAKPASEPVPAASAGPLNQESDAMLADAEGFVKIAKYQEAINILRTLTKRHPENMVIRQKLHQAYLLAAQDEAPAGGEVLKSSTPTIKPPEPVVKKKGIKVSYL